MRDISEQFTPLVSFWSWNWQCNKFIKFSTSQFFTHIFLYCGFTTNAITRYAIRCSLSVNETFSREMVVWQCATEFGIRRSNDEFNLDWFLTILIKLYLQPIHWFVTTFIVLS
jgi:hypothetical protein